jgi:hypothetical protein
MKQVVSKASLLILLHLLFSPFPHKNIGWLLVESVSLYLKQTNKQTNSVALSLQANYTD